MQNVSVYPGEIELCVQMMEKENAISSPFTALAIDNREILPGIWWKVQSDPRSVYRLN